MWRSRIAVGASWLNVLNAYSARERSARGRARFRPGSRLRSTSRIDAYRAGCPSHLKPPGNSIACSGSSLRRAAGRRSRDRPSAPVISQCYFAFGL